MNTRQMKYAIMLAEKRSFSQVAEKLNITQPALSKQILSLENELKVKLFNRNTNPLTLTPAGEYFIRAIRDLTYREEQLISSMEQFRSGEAGQLTIGISPFRSLYLVSEMLKKVKEKYPYVKIVLRETESDELRKEAAEGKYDFAIVNLPVDEYVLDVTPIVPDTLVLVVPNDMVNQIPKAQVGVFQTLPFVAFKDIPFIVVGQTQEMRKLFNKLCAQSEVTPQIAAEVIGVATARALAYAGIGATLLPLQFVESEKCNENVTVFAIADSSYIRQPVIVTRKGQYISECARYAMDLLV